MSHEASEARPETSSPAAVGLEKLIHLALPVRLIHMQKGDRGELELACTYDIHPRGARLLSTREVKVGEFVTVERGRHKSLCQVIWTANPASPLRGQFTVECTEGSRTPWEDELRQMEEQYLPLTSEKPIQRPAMNSFHRGGQNRRRSPRFPVEGGAEVAEIGGPSRVEGRLEQISEHGCLVSANDLLVPGTALRLVLNMCDVSVALRGHVRCNAKERGMGVEFNEIRQGDRPLLKYVLNHLQKRGGDEDFADLEVITDHVITEPLAVAG